MFKIHHIASTLTPKGGDDHVFNSGQVLCELAKGEHSAISVLPAPVKVDRGLTTLEMEFDPVQVKAATTVIRERCLGLGMSAQDIHVVHGSKTVAAAEWANENDVDVIGVGIHRRDSFDYFLGTTATGLLRHADSAILGCHAAKALTLNKILLAVDVDEHLPSLLKQTATLIKLKPSAELHVVSAFRPIDPYVSELNSSLARSFTNQARSAKEHQIDHNLTAAHIHYKDLEVRVGIPSEVIKSNAKKLDVDLVIMSTGRHLGFGWHTGSTTNNVMHGVETNVLALRSEAQD